jgi:hypothetical protein
MKPKVLTTGDPSLVRFRVQDIVYKDGIEKENWHGIRKLDFKLIKDNSTHDDFIELLRDENSLGKWRLFEQAIPQLPPLPNKDGTFRANRSPPLV